MGTILMIGTRKGLWLARSDDARTSWEVRGPHMNMEEVYSCLVDTRGGSTRLLAGASSSWLGPQVRRSDDLGATWQESVDGGIRFPEAVDASVERVWQLAAGAEPGVVYAGTEPGAVWRSTDGGASFALEQALWDHPHREHWQGGFGGQAFHTVLPHPADPARVTAALSTGGVYETTDGGASWHPRNQGIRAEFLPEGQQFPDFGQCVHKVARDAGDPDRLYLQNHGGVYRSDDGGGRWTSIAEGLPADFGFPVVAHPHRSGTAYVFPLVGGWQRFPPGAQAKVWRTQDAGASWEELSSGLPTNFYVGVMRDAMCADDHETVGLYVGGRNGSVWGSADEGESWGCVVDGLPDVVCVRAARIAD